MYKLLFVLMLVGFAGCSHTSSSLVVSVDQQVDPVTVARVEYRVEASHDLHQR
jgi:hypothetical protein